MLKNNNKNKNINKNSLRMLKLIFLQTFRILQLFDNVYTI